jgi:hypothetical protein
MPTSGSSECVSQILPIASANASLSAVRSSGSGLALRTRSASMSERSSGVVFSIRSSALCIASQATCVRCSVITGWLYWGPAAIDTPHHAMAQSASNSAARRNDRCASSWLNACIHASPWSK